MAEGPTREEFQGWMELLRADIHGVHVRLDVLNGRTRKCESDIAVLYDRGQQAKDGHARYAGWAGVLLSAGYWVYQMIRKIG